MLVKILLGLVLLSVVVAYGLLLYRLFCLLRKGASAMYLNDADNRFLSRLGRFLKQMFDRR